MPIRFNRDFSCRYGEIEPLSPLIRRVVARNPGPFTFHGTGTYIVGHGSVAVIDPGPDSEEHIDAVLAALQDEHVSHLLVTHTHKDHSPASAALHQVTGAPRYGYGPHGSGRFEAGVDVEEGGDLLFVPDVEVRHGDRIQGDGWTIECVYTPGHTSNHMCYALPQEQVLFSGDHVMGWSTSVIVPPDGDMGNYMRSLELLLQRQDRRYWPTHGPSIDRPKPYVRAFLEHRREREQQIIECLAKGLERIDDIVLLTYKELSAELRPAAARSVYASLLHLLEQGAIDCTEAPSLTARYRPAR